VFAWSSIKVSICPDAQAVVMTNTPKTMRFITLLFIVFTSQKNIDQIVYYLMDAVDDKIVPFTTEY
jgi:hypothetical protein